MKKVRINHPVNDLRWKSHSFEDFAAADKITITVEANGKQFETSLTGVEVACLAQQSFWQTPTHVVGFLTRDLIMKALDLEKKLAHALSNGKSDFLYHIIYSKSPSEENKFGVHPKRSWRLVIDTKDPEYKVLSSKEFAVLKLIGSVYFANETGHV